MNPNNKEERLILGASQLRQEKLKQIDALYRTQIERIYTENQEKVEKVSNPSIAIKQSSTEFDKKSNKHLKDTGYNMIASHNGLQPLQSVKSSSTVNIQQSQSSSKQSQNGTDNSEKVKASVLLRGQSTRTIQLLRRDNEHKQLKIRQLAHKCDHLIHKLKKHLPTDQIQSQLKSLHEYSDSKMQRLQNLFRIKKEEIFFKIKLQIISLLQEVGLSRQELSEFNQIQEENTLITIMIKKIKSKLKDYRLKEEENVYEQKKDKIESQKQQEKIHYLTQTNELLRLSQSKLKTKIQDLKEQLNQYLSKFKQKESQYQQNENETFRLRRLNEDLHNLTLKLGSSLKQVQSQKSLQQRQFQQRQKETNLLLTSYNIAKTKLDNLVQQKQNQLQELLIKYRFQQQQNEHLNRQMVRLKERYQWLQKQKQQQLQQITQQKHNIVQILQEYKVQNNPTIIRELKSQVEQCLRKIEEYQRSYERIVLELEQERMLLQQSEQNAQLLYENQEKQWLQRLKKIQKIKEQQLNELHHDYEQKEYELRNHYQQKEELIAQEMQAKLRALLAEKDKKTTEQLINLENENDSLRKENTDLGKVIEVKESLINQLNKYRNDMSK